MSAPGREGNWVVAFLIRVVVVAVALAVASWIVSGIHLTGATTGSKVGTLIVVAVIFGVVNAVIKPVIKVLSCPLYILTLGLFGLVVNALLFWLVGTFSSRVGLPFEVDGFWAGFWGAIVVAVVGFVLHLIIPDRLDRR
ncbi:phage holin family protein [Pseudonocardia ailaonensis]|uniref:Phage holin family protein n=1 Tax=Pseudonocardia ailaonensis TaxID=367279 RepID=A0ABN2NNZ0_9PSEU